MAVAMQQHVARSLTNGAGETASINFSGEKLFKKPGVASHLRRICSGEQGRNFIPEAQQA